MEATAEPLVEEVQGQSTGMMKAETQRVPLVAVEAQANSPRDLIRFAIEKGASIDQLERLVALSERVEDRQAAQEFAHAMAQFQAECPPIHRSSKAEITTRSGSKFGYTYAPLDEIARTINPIMARFGLSYSFDCVATDTQLTAKCTVRHIAGHSVTAVFTLPIANESAMSAQQKVGSALTYAKRQSLSAAMGLSATDEDPDAADSNHAPITDDQAISINDLIKESGVDIVRVLKFAKAAKVSEIRAADYDTIVAMLKEKIEKKESK